MVWVANVARGGRGVNRKRCPSAGERTTRRRRGRHSPRAGKGLRFFLRRDLHGAPDEVTSLADAASVSRAESRLLLAPRTNQSTSPEHPQCKPTCKPEEDQCSETETIASPCESRGARAGVSSANCTRGPPAQPRRTRSTADCTFIIPTTQLPWWPGAPQAAEGCPPAI